MSPATSAAMSLIEYGGGLRRTLGDLYDRVSTGVHGDVTSDEARFLFLNTYLYLGEVLALEQPTTSGEA